jgi:hypothetical protein
MLVGLRRQALVDKPHPAALDHGRDVATGRNAHEVRPTRMFGHTDDTRRALHVVNPVRLGILSLNFLVRAASVVNHLISKLAPVRVQTGYIGNTLNREHG